MYRSLTRTTSGLLEVVGIYSPVHLARISTGLASGVRYNIYFFQCTTHTLLNIFHKGSRKESIFESPMGIKTRPSPYPAR